MSLDSPSPPASLAGAGGAGAACWGGGGGGYGYGGGAGAAKNFQYSSANTRRPTTPAATMVFIFSSQNLFFMEAACFSN